MVVVREVLSEYTYVFMLMKIWPGYWYIQLEKMNTRVEKDNDIAVGMVKGRDQKVWRFPSN